MSVTRIRLDFLINKKDASLLYELASFYWLKRKNFKYKIHNHFLSKTFYQFDKTSYLSLLENLEKSTIINIINFTQGGLYFGK